MPSELFPLSNISNILYLAPIHLSNCVDVDYQSIAVFIVKQIFFCLKSAQSPTAVMLWFACAKRTEKNFTKVKRWKYKMFCQRGNIHNFYYHIQL